MGDEKRSGRLKLVRYIISDLHLGPGWISLSNNLEAFHDDKVFVHFIKTIIKKHKDSGAQAELIFNGDFFDPLSVSYKDKPFIIPYERVDLCKLEKIINGHPYVFDALRLLLAYNHFAVKFVVGNHDQFLHWPAVQEELIKRLGKANADRIHFCASITDGDIYISHGNTEYHTKTPEVSIVDQTIMVAFKKDGWKKLLNDEMFSTEKVLDVPLGHHLIVALQNPLRKHNLLISHMRRHGFVWLNAILGLGRKTWYRRHRFFALIAIFTCFAVVFRYWWLTRDRDIVQKIFMVLWWTIRGALEGQTPRDEAGRILERNEINVVIFGHEHVPHYETIRVGGRSKLYINSGTWQLMREVRVAPLELKWKYFRGLERVAKRVSRFVLKYLNPKVEDITEYPVVEISYFESSDRTIKLLRFNDDKRELDEFV